MHDEIKCLKKGWRRSMRTGAWYRKRDGWLAVVSGNDEGFVIVLNKRHRTFEDALAEVNEILSRGGEGSAEGRAHRIPGAVAS